MLAEPDEFATRANRDQRNDATEPDGWAEVGRSVEPKKRALVACIQKVLTVLNVIVRTATRWNPEFAVEHAATA
jgi:hypothetical protein